jgi:hypothetical protein
MDQSVIMRLDPIGDKVGLRMPTEGHAVVRISRSVGIGVILGYA